MARPSHELRVLAFESYDGGSHRAVRESLSRHSRHAWTWLMRPAHAWKWRMRVGAIEMIEEATAAGALDEPWDAIFATSLVSVSDLRALLPTRLRSVPIVFYMHENQAAYPLGDDVPEIAVRDVQFAMTNLTSVLAADRVLWNSRWNLQSFIDATADILRHSPDLAIGSWPETVRARSAIAWPPVEPPPDDFVATRTAVGPVRVAWPHRWEHDKGPDELLTLAERETERLDLRWTILGRRFRRTPPAMEAFLERFADRIDHADYAPSRSAYWERLGACDWVLSTARHEFFGIAVVEAMLAGCLPWLPSRLSYPELVPEALRGCSPGSPPPDSDAARDALHEHLSRATADEAVAQIDAHIEAVSSRRVP